MTTIGYATLQIIPSLKGVTDAIDKQIDGKAVEIIVEPKVDPKAADTAGKKTREQVEKHTKEVRVEPKVDQAASQKTGKAIGEAITAGLEGVGVGAGRTIGERLSANMSESMKRTLPAIGGAVGGMLGATIGQGLANALNSERLAKAGQAISSGLTKAVEKINPGLQIAKTVGNGISGGVDKVTAGFANITAGVSNLKDMLGEDSFAAGPLDAFSGALAKVAPIIEAVTVAQTLWNVAMSANPIGLVVIAIGALVAGLVWFFTKTELGQKIWKGFTEYLKVAWEAIKVAFSAAWDVIKAVWEAMVTKAGEVWNGIKDAFGNIVDFFGSLPGKIATAASGMWDWLKDGFKSALNFIIDAWNGFRLELKVPFTDSTFTIDTPDLPRLSGGGYTGNGPAGRIAGVVHGGEYVIRKSSTDRLQANYPGLLPMLNGYESGGLVAGTAELRRIISERFGITDIGGWRPRDKAGEHVTGRALDVMVGNDRAKGDAVKAFALANAAAIDLKWVIWRQHLTYANGTGYDQPDQGNPTANHMDHVHIFSGPGITNGLRGALGGLGVKPAMQAPATAPTPTPAVPAVSPAPDTATTPAASSSSSSVSMPSSFSGLAGWGLNALPNPTAGLPDESPWKQDSAKKFAEAGAAAVSGQVASALNVFGIPDAPPFLQAISHFVGGIKVGRTGGSAAPVSATPIIRGAPDVGGMAGATNGRPASVTNYNIRTALTEDAFIAAQRKERERAAARTMRW
jgi:hypothetical protein